MVSWTHDKRCYDNCSFTYILTWDKTNTPSGQSSSGGANTTESQYDLSGLPPGEYSMSVQAVCNENSSVVSDVVSIQISLPCELVCVCVCVCTCVQIFNVCIYVHV